MTTTPFEEITVERMRKRLVDGTAFVEALRSNGFTSLPTFEAFMQLTDEERWRWIFNYMCSSVYESATGEATVEHLYRTLGYHQQTLDELGQKITGAKPPTRRDVQ